MAFIKKKKVSARRQHVRNTKSAEKFAKFSKFINSEFPAAIGILILFVAGATVILSVNTYMQGQFWDPETPLFRPLPEIVAITAIVLLLSSGIATYLFHYKPQVVSKPSKAISLAGLFLLLLGLSKVGSFYQGGIILSTGWAVTCAMILTIVYDQRFAIGMTMFYCLLASFAATDDIASIKMFLTMISGAITCCFSLKEIRTRLKLIEVSVLAAVVVLIVSAAIGIIEGSSSVREISLNSGSAAAITVLIGLIIQGFLPLIEKIFRIATSMTLLDYSDANQPLLKKLAMEAPGTFSHSLLIGSIAESAAESIGANGLLARVGAYYHDIGKVNKPPYFVENQMGSVSMHEQLSPAMSQLIIVGHVKDGIEIAHEYGLPAVLRQFIETHHGTTLIEYFYDQAKKQQDDKQKLVSESEFRYPGPKPKTKEAAIVMISDAVESATRSVNEVTPTRIETIVHKMAMKRLQDGQFDECDLTLRELSKIEASIAKSLAAHHHGRIAYPKAPDEPFDDTK